MNNDPELSELLQKWKAGTKPSPSFQRQVWARISSERKTPLERVRERLTEWFVIKLPQPLYAGAVVAVFVFVAFGFASISARLNEKTENTAMKERYIRSINPLAKATERQGTL